MAKPLVVILDYWKPEEFFKPVSDIVNLRIEKREEAIKLGDDVSCLILHNPIVPKEIDRLVEEARDIEIPVIIQGCPTKAREYYEKKYLSHKNIYFVSSYSNLFEKIKDLFTLQIRNN